VSLLRIAGRAVARAHAILRTPQQPIAVLEHVLRKRLHPVEE